MRGIDAQQFVDLLSFGVEQTFAFRGRVLFVEGSRDAGSGTWCARMDQWEPETLFGIWEARGTSMEECLEEFLNAPLFDGMSFWEAEGEMESLYA